MLLHLAVRNLAIVDNVELELDGGMTALTGETGAGKSLIVDALQLVVGARGSASLVRAGASSAEVHALFSADEATLAWLREHELEDDEPTCILRRTLGSDGRSRAFINSRPVALAQLRELGERLVDVHGQHAHQALLKPPAQRELIDQHGELADRLTELAANCAQLRELDAEIAALSPDGEDPGSRVDFLQFQIDELKAQPLDTDTLDAINAEHKKLANAAEILKALAAIEHSLDADDGVHEQLAQAGRHLESLLRLDEGLASSLQLMRDGADLIAEARSQLHRYAERLQADSQRLDELEQMLATLHDLARKHRCTAAQLHERLEALEHECARISGGEARLKEASAARERALKSYRKQAAELSALRRKHGKALTDAANEVLATLGMVDARVEFSIEHSADARPMPNGTDEVALCVSTNPGQPLMPIGKVASGGELSRIALAMQTCAINTHGAHTVVFDEVDTGVGGAVAAIVGRRMRDLGAERQVLSVTHLPQVAALAHHHVLVSKLTANGANRSEIVTLSSAEREQEIARMLGGLDVTRKTLAHAREMLASASAKTSSEARS